MLTELVLVAFVLVFPFLAFAISDVAGRWQRRRIDALARHVALLARSRARASRR